MTNEELQKILVDKNKKLSVDELEEIIYQLKYDSYNAAIEISMSKEEAKEQFYLGEENAFHIALLLLDRLEVSDAMTVGLDQTCNLKLLR